MFNPENITPEQNVENKEKKSKLKEFMNSPLGRKIRRGAIYSWIAMSALVVGETTKNVVSFNKEAGALAASQPENPLEQERHSANIRFIENKIGSDAITDIAKRHIAESKRNSPDTDDVKIENFDDLGIKKETLEKMWADGDTYPNGWINEEIETITLNNRPLLDKNYDARVSNYGGRQTIVMMKDALSDYLIGLKDIDRYFAHESGHANDWQCKKNVSFEQRIALLTDVLRQIELTDIEDLYEGYSLYDFKDEQQKNRIQAKETWAEMCEFYFSDPELFKDVYPEAFKIVDDWVKNTDPNFDPASSAKKRQEIMAETGEDWYLKQNIKHL